MILYQINQKVMPEMLNWIYIFKYLPLSLIQDKQFQWSHSLGYSRLFEASFSFI